MVKDIYGYERILLDIYGKGRKLNRLGVFLEFSSIPGIRNKVRFGWETIFPKKETLRSEFGGSSPYRRVLFYPKRIFGMVTLFLKVIYLFTIGLVRSA